MYTVLENGRIADEHGNIALRWNTLTQRDVMVGQHEYLFAIRSNISLAWVYPEDVDRLLEMHGGCCGGTAQLCHLANELDAKRWLGLGVW